MKRLLLQTCLVLVAGLLAEALEARDETCPFADTGETLLNSERIERCFGSYGLEILDPVDGLRAARLYSGAPGDAVGRTLALTGFAPDPSAELVGVMSRIHAGASIGHALKSDGWSVLKDTVFVGEVAAGRGLLAHGRFVGVTPGNSVALHVYRLTAMRDGRRHLVARIAEIYHPGYLTRADLERLHPLRASPDREDCAFEARVISALGLSSDWKVTLPADASG